MSLNYSKIPISVIYKFCFSVLRAEAGSTSEAEERASTFTFILSWELTSLA